MPKRKTILLTGANGFCASRVQALLQGCFDVLALPRAALDITDRDACVRALREAAPYAVLHSAAIADMRACEADPQASVRVNVLGAENMALACAEAGARMIHFSTDQVYSGTPSPAPHAESAALCPGNVYGRHKQEAEALIAQTGCHCAAVRLTWMYDFPQRNLRVGRNLLALCRRAAEMDEPVTLASRTGRGITYVYEVAERLPALLEAPAGVYNFGSAGDTTPYEAAKLMLALMGAGRRAARLLIPEEEPDGKYADLRMDCTAAAAFVSPFPSTEEGIRRAFCEYGYSV